MFCLCRLVQWLQSSCFFVRMGQSASSKIDPGYTVAVKPDSDAQSPPRAAKIVLVGPTKAGKSELIRRYCDNEFWGYVSIFAFIFLIAV